MALAQYLQPFPAPVVLLEAQYQQEIDRVRPLIHHALKHGGSLLRAYWAGVGFNLVLDNRPHWEVCGADGPPLKPTEIYHRYFGVAEKQPSSHTHA